MRHPMVLHRNHKKNKVILIRKRKRIIKKLYIKKPIRKIIKKCKCK